MFLNILNGSLFVEVVLFIGLLNSSNIVACIFSTVSLTAWL